MVDNIWNIFKLAKWKLFYYNFVDSTKAPSPKNEIKVRDAGKILDMCICKSFIHTAQGKYILKLKYLIR